MDVFAKDRGSPCQNRAFFCTRTLPLRWGRNSLGPKVYVYAFPFPELRGMAISCNDTLLWGHLRQLGNLIHQHAPAGKTFIGSDRDSHSLHSLQKQVSPHH